MHTHRLEFPALFFSFLEPCCFGLLEWMNYDTIYCFSCLFLIASCILIFLQVAGVPGVTETLFLARQSAIAEEKRKSDETPMMYSCGLCGKGYRSSKAHAQHLNSKTHLMRVSEATDGKDEGSTIIKPFRRVPKEPLRHVVEEDEDSEESEWDEVDPDEDLLGEASDSLGQLKVNENPSDVDMDEDEDDFGDLDPSCCFMCDLEHGTVESCIMHLHKQHGFFIPDIEYLKDPKGLLTYLSLKVITVLLYRTFISKVKGVFRHSFPFYFLMYSY